MSFSNATPFAALDVPTTDHTGREVVIAIVKATFALKPNGGLTRADAPEPVRVNDECHELDNPTSSLRRFSDVCSEKRGTDVVVYGDAVAPRPVTKLDLAVRVKELTVPLRVHGERVFTSIAGSARIGAARPFERMPVVYERAYGGTADEMRIVESRNPSGVGVARRAADLDGRRAPQIEHPARPHTSFSDTHAPVGFGPIMTHWTPRREHAGTLDDAWMKTRMPIMPHDFDVRFNNAAHPALLIDEGLVPGDVIAVSGMAPGEPFAFAVPELGIVLRARFDASGTVTVRPPIDTVFIRPNDRLVEVVARKAFAQGRGRDLLRELTVDLED
ncbi:MAG: DUF2169 domain-containing protein [Myxococcales bacterium]|nr:DUF2169 domain-containing protein [Myxococcales bacterium]